MSTPGAFPFLVSLHTVRRGGEAWSWSSETAAVATDVEKRQQAPPAGHLCAWRWQSLFLPLPTTPFHCCIWGCPGFHENRKKSQRIAAKWWRQPMLAHHLPKAKDDMARAAKPAPQNWENQESMEMFLICYCYCGHPCMPSKGEMNENCHVTCKCPPHKTKTNKNQDFKKKKHLQHLPRGQSSNI